MLRLTLTSEIIKLSHVIRNITQRVTLKIILVCKQLFAQNALCRITIFAITHTTTCRNTITFFISNCSITAFIQFLIINIFKKYCRFS